MGVTRIEVLVVGGGLAGSAAAIALARAGREVMLVERETRAQHKVCGEFLSREAQGYLRKLDVDIAAMGAVAIERVRVAGARGVSEARLPFVGMSVTRRRLDKALLAKAEESGARVMRGSAVECVAEGTAKLDAGDTIEATAVMMANGKHDVRGWSRPAGRQNDLVAFKMYWQLAAEQAEELAGHVELLLYRGGYAGLQPVEDGLANLCCLIERSELRGGWDGLLTAMMAQCPHLAKRLKGAKPMLEKALAVAAIPYGFVRERAEGMWWLGDQAAVISSFTGDGMSIALHTASVAAMMYMRGGTAGMYQRTMREQLSRQVQEATLLSLGMVSQPAMMAFAARMWPGAMGLIAERTRIDSDFVAA